MHQCLLKSAQSEGEAVDLQHKGVWWVHKDGGIFSRGGLQAKLGICGLGVVGEGDVARQFAVVQHLLVMLS